MNIPIVPALIPSSREAVLEFTTAVAPFAHEIQIDVVDGVFVPAVSWPYEPNGEPLTIKQATDPFTLEVDLMTVKPIAAAEAWYKAGADMLVFHIETVSLAAMKAFSSNKKVSIGVSCHGDTSLADLFLYAAEADYVQLMGINTIGAQGVKFDDKVLDKISAVRERFPDMMISIDGSVNTETISKLKAAGAHRFVSGSAILGSENPAEAYQELRRLVD